MKQPSTHVKIVDNNAKAIFYVDRGILETHCRGDVFAFMSNSFHWKMTSSDFVIDLQSHTIVKCRFGIEDLVNRAIGV